MPVILPPKCESSYLAAAEQMSSSEAQALLAEIANDSRRFVDGQLALTAVGPAVGSPRNEGPQLILPAAPQPAQLRLL